MAVKIWLEDERRAGSVDCDDMLRSKWFAGDVSDTAQRPGRALSAAAFFGRRRPQGSRLKAKERTPAPRVSEPVALLC
jgi:hypothetical protein